VTPPILARAVEYDIASEAEATSVVNGISSVMAQLSDVIEEETALVRAGRLTAAAAVVERKSELARAFTTYASRVRASARCLARTAPRVLEDLRQQHEHFRARLQVNLTVLATARAVAEGIVRGVSNQMARRSAPQVYGASGRHVAARRSGVPIAVSRSL
jgi:hypothetical protein